MALAVVTGANRGIGREVAKQLIEKDYVVIVTGRNKEAIVETARQLREETGVERVEPFVVDVTNQEHAIRLAQYIGEHFGGELEILVNNAGILLDGWTADSHIYRISSDVINQTLDINTVGAFKVLQALVPMMVNSGKKGRVVNVSSGMGALNDMGTGSVAYRISKAGLNVLTRVFANETKSSNVKINSVCPGWVRTDMGGEGASRTVQEGASGIVWAATLPDDGPTGGFFRDGKPIEW